VVRQRNKETSNERRTALCPSSEAGALGAAQADACEFSGESDLSDVETQVVSRDDHRDNVTRKHAETSFTIVRSEQNGRSRVETSSAEALELRTRKAVSGRHHSIHCRCGDGG
jgi:hypothetical protein